MIPLLCIFLGGPLIASIVLGVATHLIFKYGLTRRPPLDFSDIEKTRGTHWEPFWERICACKERFLALDIEKVSITSRDGLRLAGYYIAAPEPTGRAALFMHGLHTSAHNDFCCLTEFYLDHGIDVLLIDHRTHGASEGKYIGFGVLESRDCADWTKYLEQRFPKKRIYLHGISMGATTALMALSRDISANVAGVIADCGFTSPWDVLVHRFRKLKLHSMFTKIALGFADIFVRRIAGYGLGELSATDSVRNSELPILFFHGERDDVVPISMGRANYEAAADGRLIEIPEADHGTCFFYETDLCIGELFAFIDSHK